MTSPTQSPQPDKSRTIPEELGGQRLDRILAELWPSYSRTRWKTSILDGLVRIDGELARRPNQAVPAGSRLDAQFPAERVAVAPNGSPIVDLNVLHEDEDLVVIDKPAGLIVHSNDRFAGGTLADLVMERYGTLPAVQGAHRRGIVHRLDRLTSGVILIGRTEHAQLNLKEQFQARTVLKTYLAFVYGTPRFESDWIETAIAPDPRHIGRYRPVTTGAVEVEGMREASTFYSVRTRYHNFAEIECQPKTGRTHQIRVHLTSIGMPIIGDVIYRHRGAVPHPLPAAVECPERHCLHAQRIEFDHPGSGERVHFEAPLPEDLLALRRGLQEHAPAR